MDIIKLAVRQPITVAVGILFTVLVGIVAIGNVPVEMTPQVDDTVIAVTTMWENANPAEIESEVIDPQEEKLQGLSNLYSMTSSSSLGRGQIRLQFAAGVDKDVAMREVSDKLREVPTYPEEVDEPVIEASDPETNDYIAWYILETTDANFDARELFDFADDRLKPQLERIPGISEVNVLGGTEREVHILFDPEKLAQHRMTTAQLAQALRNANQNFSGGALKSGKSDIRVRAVGRFASAEQILATVIRRDQNGTVTVRDVATVKESFKEHTSFVRTKGQTALALNFQKEPGSNVLDIMTALKEKVAALNAEGALLESEGQRLGVDGKIILRVSYDSTTYIYQALTLVKENIFVGSALAIVVLLIFLRSIRSVGIITLAIPVSIIGTVIAMFAFGRSVNVISLAGMAFAVGMVVDNSIVVLENIYRHLEMGKKRLQAAYDGTREVAGAVLASTLTTVVVFLPILLITDQAGQLFRDIALAIMAAVTFSYIVSITLIPSAGALILKVGDKKIEKRQQKQNKGLIERFIYAINGSIIARLIVLIVFISTAIIGTMKLMPPIDYLPTGNRNMVFGLMITPPGYNLDQLSQLGERVEKTIKPFWEGAEDRPAYSVPNDPSGRKVVAPKLKDYFLVSFSGMLFQGTISSEPQKAVDNLALLSAATTQDKLPGTYAFAFQFPLFNTGGSSGSAIKVDLVGPQIEQVKGAAAALMVDLMGNYGPAAVRPDPANFMVNSPELRLIPDHAALAESGLSLNDLGISLAANADGLILGDFDKDGELIDLKLKSLTAEQNHYVSGMAQVPIATNDGHIVPMNKLAAFKWIDAADQIKRVGRQKAVTLEFTPPKGMPLEEGVIAIKTKIAAMRQAGIIPPSVEIGLEGSAGKLRSIRQALIGDGTITGLLGSSLFLAVAAIYLLMCILFQSWTQPLIIMFSVPLATFGGFLGLAMVHKSSLADPYLPVQNLDVLTILGFVILAGVVVNNAILIVAQTKNLMDEEELDPRTAIAKAVQSRVRPIFMSTLTSVGGMLPLVLNPGSGSELYRGLGAVVVGGMVVSTLFTLILIPVMLSLSMSLFKPKKKTPALKAAAIVLLVLTGCKSIDTEKIVDEKKKFEIPAKWRAPQTPSTNQDLAYWWQSFNDHKLNALIHDVQNSNLEIKAAYQNIMRSRALILGAESAHMPQFEAGSSYTRQRASEKTLFSFAGSDPYSEWRTGLSMNWELDFFGRLQEGIKASQFDLVEQQEKLRQIHISIAADTARLYLQIRSLQEQISIAQNNIDLQEKNLQFVNARFKAGTSTELDINEARELLTFSQAEIAPIQRDLQLSLNSLSLLMGKTPGSVDERFLNNQKLPQIKSHINTGLPRDLIRRRPDIRAAEARIHAEASRLNFAQAEYLPKFALNGNIGIAAEQFWKSDDHAAKTYTFGPSFSWRILDTGAVEGEVKAQEASLKQSLINYRNTVLKAFNEVENSLVKFQREKQRYQALQKTLDSANKSLAMARALYIKGRRDYQTVISSLLNRQQAQLRLTASTEAQSQALVELYRSLGGGWQ